MPEAEGRLRAGRPFRRGARKRAYWRKPKVSAGARPAVGGPGPRTQSLCRAIVSNTVAAFQVFKNEPRPMTRTAGSARFSRAQAQRGARGRCRRGWPGPPGDAASMIQSGGARAGAFDGPQRWHHARRAMITWSVYMYGAHGPRQELQKGEGDGLVVGQARSRRPASGNIGNAGETYTAARRRNGQVRARERTKARTSRR